MVANPAIKVVIEEVAVPTTKVEDSLEEEDVRAPTSAQRRPRLMSKKRLAVEMVGGEEVVAGKEDES